MNCRNLLSLCILAGISCALAFAQGGATGAISGTVQDATGAVVAKTKVEVVNSSTGELVRSGVTDASGFFTLALLPPGTYSVQVSAPGFAVTEVREVAVRITETTRLNLTLKAKTVREKVEVTAEAETVKTTDATTGESLVGNTIRELPLATRNYQQLLTLSAGASSSLNSASQLGRGDVRINVNGGREDNNNYQIDGVSANDNSIGGLANTPLPSPDSIAEFKVGTSLYDATQGRNGGGNINAVLKSGTTSFHFDAFEYFRNTVLDANDYFLNRQGLARPTIQQNIFGASLGGPIGPKARFGFFFFNYQGTRQASGDSPGAIISTLIPYVPASARTSADEMAAECLPEGGVMDPVAFNILTVKSNQFGAPANGYLYPMPNAPGHACGDLVPFAVSRAGSFDDNQFTANWDRDFRGGKDRISERYFYSNSNLFQPFSMGDGLAGASATQNMVNFPTQVPLHDRNGSLAEIHIFSNAAVNEIRLGVNVISYKYTSPTIYTSDTHQPITDTLVGITRPTDNATSDLYRFMFLGSGIEFGPKDTNPLRNLGNTITLRDTFSYVHGAHSLRAGFEMEHSIVHRFIPISDNGQFFYVPTFDPNTGTLTSDFQNFMMGAPPYLVYAWSGLANHEYHVNSYAMFAQDDYRVTPTLTMNLGFRTEFVGAPYDALCHTGNNDPSKLTPGVGGLALFYPSCISNLNLPGITGSAPPSLTNNAYTTVIEPRIGFAYDLLGKHTTSIRGGYGIYSVREDVSALDNLSVTPPAVPGAYAVVPGLANALVGAIPPMNPTLQQLLPFVPTASIFQGFPGGCNLFMTGAPAPVSTDCFPNFSGNAMNFFTPVVPRDWIAPTIQQWNLDVERSFGQGWAVEAAYVGTKGTHLREGNDLNQARLASPSNPIVLTGPDGTQYSITSNTFDNLNARAHFVGLAPLAYQAFSPDANSNYNALQVTLKHRFSKGLYLQSAYTFAKSIDDTSTGASVFDTRFNDQSSGKDTRARSDFDHRHRFVTSYDYTLPFYSQQHGFSSALLGGWEVSGVVTAQSGTPFNVFDSFGGTAYGLSSPNIVTPTWAPGFSCANALTSGSVSSRLDGFINRAAFVNDPAVPYTDDGSTGFGNVSRNCLQGPRQFNIDFSLAKTIRLSEHQSLKFTAEFFNLTNTPSFANPAITDINSAPCASQPCGAGDPTTFGPITSVVGTPRLIQFALRYAF